MSIHSRPTVATADFQRFGICLCGINRHGGRDGEVVMSKSTKAFPPGEANIITLGDKRKQ